MEEKIYVNQVSQYLNKEIITEFLVVQKELREGKKDHFIRMKLADNSGTISANIWNNARVISDKFDEGDVVKIKGIVISYNSQLQITVNKVRKLDDAEFDLSNFIQATTKDVNKLAEKLFSYIDGIKNEYLQNLLKTIFEDKEFFTLFAKTPAAKTWHHNYIGGLLEHTVSVAKICEFQSMQYKLDKDLLITGAILHDIGKVYEYNIKSTIEFSIIGRLVGHIPLADNFICEKAGTINNFPKDILMKLRHLILAHHGEYEKASARLPQTIEAVALHHADNTDAQIIGVQQLVEATQDPEAIWTEFDRLNSRYYYLK
jgi:3'-5' exoribonuclease